MIKTTTTDSGSSNNYWGTPVQQLKAGSKPSSLNKSRSDSTDQRKSLRTPKSPSLPSSPKKAQIHKLMMIVLMRRGIVIESWRPYSNNKENSNRIMKLSRQTWPVKTTFLFETWKWPRLPDSMNSTYSVSRLKQQQRMPHPKTAQSCQASKMRAMQRYMVSTRIILTYSLTRNKKVALTRCSSQYLWLSSQSSAPRRAKRNSTSID